MSRLSIEITEEQHKKIKAIAALNGGTIRDYVLERILPKDDKDEEALNELRKFLQPRIDEAKNGDIVNTSARDIFESNL